MPQQHTPIYIGRKIRLIFLISIELIVFQVLVAIFNPYVKTLPFFLPNLLATSLILANLFIVKTYKTIQLSGYILSAIFYGLVLLVNLLIGGPNTPAFLWLYLLPIIASATIGIRGLVVYGTITFLTILSFMFWQHTPWMALEVDYNWYIKMVDYCFILLMLITVLLTFLSELQAHELALLTTQKNLWTEQEKLKYLSKHDYLTGLPNRSYFYDYLSQSIKRLAPNEVITIFYMDLNKFKPINDKYGHNIGDFLLTQVSKRLQRCFREQDFVARVGGDEFICIIKQDENESFNGLFTQRIRQNLQAPISDNDKLSIRISTSIGHASFPTEADDINALISLADKRMYIDKKNSKHPRVC